MSASAVSSMCVVVMAVLTSPVSKLIGPTPKAPGAAGETAVSQAAPLRATSRLTSVSPYRLTLPRGPIARERSGR
jgi:hypothetical protein